MVDSHIHCNYQIYTYIISYKTHIAARHYGVYIAPCDIHLPYNYIILTTSLSLWLRKEGNLNKISHSSSFFIRLVGVWSVCWRLERRTYMCSTQTVKLGKLPRHACWTFMCTNRASVRAWARLCLRRCWRSKSMCPVKWPLIVRPRSWLGSLTSTTVSKYNIL